MSEYYGVCRANLMIGGTDRRMVQKTEKRRADKKE